MTDHDGYLWDRSGPPDPFVERLERHLRPLAFEPAATGAPSATPRAARRPSLARRWLVAAACVLLATGLGLYRWRLDWPVDRPWPLQASGDAHLPARLAVGEALDLGADDSATARIARLGRLDIRPSTSLTLDATGGGRHWLTLSAGEVSLRVWAPPRAVSIRTPAGTIVDLGCAFDLEVRDNRAALRVHSGWVEAANAFGESLVPEGAATVMRADRAPGVPIYQDATPAFALAVRAIESAARDAEVDAELDTVGRDARARDVMTVLTLLARQPGPRRGRLAGIAASLVPVPDDVTARRRRRR